MKTHILITIGIGVVFILGLLWYITEYRSTTYSPHQKACTLEAKICPDGTAVGRTGPNCEFAPCPTH